MEVKLQASMLIHLLNENEMKEFIAGRVGNVVRQQTCQNVMILRKLLTRLTDLSGLKPHLYVSFALLFDL